MKARAPSNALLESFLTLNSVQDVRNYLTDLCTPQEIAAMAERLEIAILLSEKNLSYRDISHRTGASTTTVARVARFLNDEPHGGYRKTIQKLQKDKTNATTKHQSTPGSSRSQRATG